MQEEDSRQSIGYGGQVSGGGGWFDLSTNDSSEYRVALSTFSLI